MRIASVKVLIALILFAASVSLAGQITGSVKMQVIAKFISFDPNPTSLKFGSFAPSVTSGGEIIINNSVSSATNGIQLITDPSTPRSSAQTVVNGEPGNRYTYVLPASVLLNGPGPDMVATLRFNSGNSARTFGTADAAGYGHDTVIIDGTLAVGQNQPSGDYSGSFQAQADY